ncbi:MAG: hypothetical protein WKG00_13945 [Polyangiaceae bacterium]
MPDRCRRDLRRRRRPSRLILDGDIHEEKTTTWTTTWTGTWRQTKGKLDLALRRQVSACSRTEVLRRGVTRFAPTTTPCAAPPERLVLRCEDGPVTAAGIQVPAWTCHAADPGPPDPSVPLPWVFGKARCLEKTGGCPSCGPIEHRPCAP